MAAGTLAWLLAGPALLAGCASGLRTVTLDEAELNRLIGSHFPQQQRLLEVAELTVDTPRVWLIPERNRLGTRLGVHGGERWLGRPLAGGLTLDAALRYDPSDATIRLTQVKVEQFALDAGSASLPVPLQFLASQVAQRALEDMAVYQIRPEQLERLNGAGFKPGAVTVTARGVEVTLAPR